MPRTMRKITVFSSQIITKRSNAFPGMNEVGDNGAMTPLLAAYARWPKSAAAMLKIEVSFLAHMHIPPPSETTRPVRGKEFFSRN